MKSYVDESEDAATDDAEDPRKNVQRIRSNGDGTASHDGAEGFIDSVPPIPSYGVLDGARDEGASSSQGTQDVQQDHQGGPVQSNEQSVEPSGQDEANPGGAQEEVEEGAAGGGSVEDLDVVENAYGLVLFEQVTMHPLPDEMAIDPLPDEMAIDPFPDEMAIDPRPLSLPSTLMIRRMCDAMANHAP